MASSPPYSHSPLPYNSSFPPHTPSGLTLKRPSDMSGANPKRRKHSTLSVTSAHSVHPLRQTSFPPDGGDSRAYSPNARSPSMDAASLVSGSAAPSRIGKKRGRKPKNATDDTGSTLGKGSAAVSLVGGRGQKQGQEEEEDDDDDGAGMQVEATSRTEEQKRAERYNRSLLVEALDPEQFARYERWRSSKLGDSVVRRLVNQTLSQSVPLNVVIAVKSVSKVFAGEIIELARKVQTQYMRASIESPTEDPRAIPSYPPSRYPTQPDSMANTPMYGMPADSAANGDEEGRTYTEAEIAQWEKNQEEERRPPLTPDHLREALRRYKAERGGGLVGLMQLAQTQHPTGVERFGTKLGGKRMLG